MSMETPLTDATDDDASVTVSQLQAELGGSDEEATTAASDIVSEVQTQLFGDATFTFEESHVKSSLDELLLSLVGLRSSDTHGKQLLDDLAGEFDTVLSPGTVYPRLHELCDDEILEQRELVQTKEYMLADRDEVRNEIATAARQHLALGMVMHAALERGEFA
ncbi:MAG: hypothetical protein ACI8UR_000308 [Natronomonas sp.]|jgi:hypothetical protein|uniref:PadR family transcriptional regulator n=1 Tax=Natronomonas sp. TaxID=2184060 RepID=UPI00398971B6